MINKLFFNRRFFSIILPAVVLMLGVGGLFVAAKTGHLSSLADDLGYQGRVLVQVNFSQEGNINNGKVSLSRNSDMSSVVDEKLLGQGMSPDEAYFYNLTYTSYYASANFIVLGRDGGAYSCRTPSPQRIAINQDYQFVNLPAQCTQIGLDGSKVSFSVTEKGGTQNSGEVSLSGVNVALATNPTKNCSTSNFGQCDIDGVSGGQYDVTLSKFGYSLILQSISVDSDHRFFKYSMVKQTTPIATGGIVGMITGNGQPLVGTTVTVTTDPVSYETSFDSSGGLNYSILSIPIGYYSVTVAHTNYASQTKSGIIVTSGRITSVDFDLQEKAEDSAGNLEGLVYTTDQSLKQMPVSGAELIISTAPYKKTVSTSNNSTNYWFGGSVFSSTSEFLPIGYYFVTVKSPEYTTVTQTVQIKPGDNRLNIELKKVVFSGYGSVTGNVYTITDGVKKPVNDASIILNVVNQQIVKTTNGLYSFGHVPAGYYQMVVTHPDCLGEFKTITVAVNGTLQLDIELKLKSTQTGTLSGKIIWNPDGFLRPASGVTLELKKGLSGQTIQQVISTDTGFSGDGIANFIFKGVPVANDYVIKYSKPGFTTDYFLNNVFARAGGDTWVGEQSLNLDYSADFGSLDANFKELISGQWVDTSLPVDVWINTSNNFKLTGSKGHYGARLPSGFYLLTFKIQGQPEETWPINITRGVPETFEWKIGETSFGSLSGKVISKITNRTLVNATVVIYTNPIRIAKTDSKGNYRFDNVPAGRYRVVVTKSGLVSQRRSIYIGRDPVVFNFRLLGL